MPSLHCGVCFCLRLRGVFWSHLLCAWAPCPLEATANAAMNGCALVSVHACAPGPRPPIFMLRTPSCSFQLSRSASKKALLGRNVSLPSLPIITITPAPVPHTLASSLRGIMSH